MRRPPRTQRPPRSPVAGAASSAAQDAMGSARSAELVAPIATPVASNAALPTSEPISNANLPYAQTAENASPQPVEIEHVAMMAPPAAGSEQAVAVSPNAPPAATESALHCASSVECVKAMLGSARAENLPAAMEAAQTLDALPKPARGDRTMARKLNQQGLGELSLSHATDAAGTFISATQADPRRSRNSKQPGLRLFRSRTANQGGGTQRLRLSLLNPRRTSVWAPLANTLAREHRVGPSRRGDVARLSIFRGQAKDARFHRLQACGRDRP